MTSAFHVTAIKLPNGPLTAREQFDLAYQICRATGNTDLVWGVKGLDMTDPRKAASNAYLGRTRVPAPDLATRLVQHRSFNFFWPDAFGRQPRPDLDAIVALNRHRN